MYLCSLLGGLDDLQEASNTARPLFVRSFVVSLLVTKRCNTFHQPEASAGLQGILKGNSPREKPLHPMLEVDAFLMMYFSYPQSHVECRDRPSLSVTVLDLFDSKCPPGAGTNAFRNGSTTCATSTGCSLSLRYLR